MKTMELFKLDGKWVLLTGGGRGIGKIMGYGLAEAGANLVIASRNKENLEKTSSEIVTSCGVDVLPIVCDLSRMEEINKLVETLMQYHIRIDVLINNSGIAKPGHTLSYPIELWDEHFNINVRGIWALTQKISKQMAENGGGNIINISSIWGLKGSDEKLHPAVPYNCTKAAVNMLTKNLAVKLAPFKIRVNAIAPGFFPDGMMSYINKPEFEEDYSKLTEMVPMRRFGGADDLKGAAVFLASDASAYMTGHILYVDGGFSAS